jgi:A/G-specific adenine glycosylase
MQKKSYLIIHQNLLTWYKQHGRVTLPWRNSKNAYEIYLSEIMLQQTQVKTVLSRFYFPFLEKFPTLKDVAVASVDDVLKAWEGLGYYSRARNLHKTALLTKGHLPSSASKLIELPGIGPSTAHAVACFAFNEALPILDANVKRILYRFFAIEKHSDKRLWEKAYELFDRDNAYIYNQTLMDIGALVCTHKNPNCISCPLSSLCQGRKEPLRYPEKKIKKAKPIKNHFMLIYTHDNRYALSQNSAKLLNGLWGFPQVSTFLENKNTTRLSEFTQHYTHFRLNVTLILISSPKEKLYKYFNIEEIHELALSTADRKALKILENQLQ